MSDGVLEYIYCPYCKEMEGCVCKPNGNYVCPETGREFTQAQSVNASRSRNW